MIQHPSIHLFNSFHSPFGGSELETLDLYRELSGVADVHLWTTSSRACPSLIKHHDVQPLGALRRPRPDGGNYIFTGAHWRGKLWPWLIRPPQRLIYVYNTFHPKLLQLTARVPLGWPRPEYVTISEFQRQLLGIEAQVHPSPIDLGRFTPAPERTTGPFRIGRMSRDTPDKHHSEDAAVYRAVAAWGAECWVQGGRCLANAIDEPAIHLRPAGEYDAAEFLQGLDVFYYRTGDHVETFGRVVFEAMACGLAVVCHRRGGYADWIEHGKNGLLFDSTEQAIQYLGELKADPALRHRLGAAARSSVETLYGEQAKRQRLDFYTAARY